MQQWKRDRSHYSYNRERESPLAVVSPSSIGRAFAHKAGGLEGQWFGFRQGSFFLPLLRNSETFVIFSQQEIIHLKCFFRERRNIILIHKAVVCHTKYTVCVSWCLSLTTIFRKWEKLFTCCFFYGPPLCMRLMHGQFWSDLTTYRTPTVLFSSKEGERGEERRKWERSFKTFYVARLATITSGLVG